MDTSRLEASLTAALKAHDVPGAVVGVLHGGERTTAAAGVLNLDTGVETTPDSVFQIGSMSKSWTAAVVMSLVDEGRLDLDEPVRTYLPDFKVADPEVSANVTPRHLLTHSSGIDGDFFEDFGRGDDCLERYVEGCSKLGQTHPLGETMSYCNTGYSILGRIIEVLTDKVWDAAMRERLFAPLGLKRTSTLPEEAILHRVSVGHMKLGPDEPVAVAPVWLLPRITGPAGLINSTVDDVLTFSTLFLNGGKSPEGESVLSPEGIATMERPHVEIPDPHSLGTHWGAGLIVFDWGGRTVYGHDGDTLGQHSIWRIAPDEGLAAVLLSNGPNTRKVAKDVFGEVFSELAGITIPEMPKKPSEPPKIDLTPYAGAYERLAIRYELTAESDALVGTVEVSGPLASMIPDPVTKIRMIPIDERTFLTYAEGEEEPSPAAFYRFEDGVPGYLHNGVRANRRVDA
jgi:CubicO group peptidase (beta-lactamase class C family)